MFFLRIDIMKEVKSIVQIRKEDISKAKQAFADLMSKTELLLNEKSAQNVSLIKSKNSFQLEKWSEEVIKEACNNTPFSADNVKLVSGYRFPDIITEKYYGVEVKTTVKNHWSSVGSSIVESTRDINVEDIYMLFGNLGGDIPRFKCKPYQSVLSDITVTHSPRYLIDMNITEAETIFSKMNIDYDVFRTSSESIEMVRKYYRDKALQEKKKEMPWWLTTDNSESVIGMNIRLWNTLPIEEKQILIAMSLILFPKLLSPKQSNDKYHDVVLWLCSYRSIVVPNIRDLFSAGGKIKYVDNKSLQGAKPKIFKTIVMYSDIVKSLLLNPDTELLQLIEEFNPMLLNNGEYYKNWLEICNSIDSVLVDWINRKPILQ